MYLGESTGSASKKEEVHLTATLTSGITLVESQCVHDVHDDDNDELVTKKNEEETFEGRCKEIQTEQGFLIRNEKPAESEVFLKEEKTAPTLTYQVNHETALLSLDVSLNILLL